MTAVNLTIKNLCIKYNGTVNCVILRDRIIQLAMERGTTVRSATQLEYTVDADLHIAIQSALIRPTVLFRTTVRALN